MIIVCPVNNKSFNGRNRELLSKENETNQEEILIPLKNQLNDLANLIGNFGYIMAALIVGVIRNPEGLPMVVAISLDYIQFRPNEKGKKNC